MFVDRFVVFCVNGCAFLTCMINHASVKMCGCLSSHEALCGKNIFCVCLCVVGGGGGGWRGVTKTFQTWHDDNL